MPQSPIMVRILPLAAFFLCVHLPVSAYMVPKEIGAPSKRYTPESWVKSPMSTATLADAAADAAVDKSRVISLGAADASQRPLNLDFIPRAGWTGTVFPSVASPVLCSVAVSVATLWAYESQGYTGIGTTGHSILGVLVSFLAVFRTQVRGVQMRKRQGALTGRPPLPPTIFPLPAPHHLPPPHPRSKRTPAIGRVAATSAY